MKTYTVLRTPHRHWALPSIICSLAAMLTLWDGSIFVSSSMAQSAKKPVASENVRELAQQQKQLAQRFGKLEELFIRMSELEAASNPTRAGLLMQAAQLSKQLATHQRLSVAGDLLSQGQFTRAIQEQEAGRENLKKLLELLQSENRSSRLRDERARLQEIQKEIQRLEQIQRGQTARTESGQDMKQAAADQKDIHDQLDKVSKDLNADKDGKEDKANENPSTNNNDKSDADKSKGENSQGDKPNSEKPESDKPKTDKPSTDKPSGEKNKDDKSDANKSDADKSDADKSDADKSDADKSDGDKSKSDKPKSDKPKTDKPKDDKRQPDKDADKKPKSDDSPGGNLDVDPSQSQEAQESESNSQESSQDQKPSKPESREEKAKKRVEAAKKRMEKAQQKLQEKDREEAVKEQREAERELRDAIEELEKILRQLREEEIERSLVDVETRLRKMLDLQRMVREQTETLSNLSGDARDRTLEIQANKLSIEQTKVVMEGQRALLLLQDEGSSKAFPEALEQVNSDAQNVSKRLTEGNVSLSTQAIEDEIIGALEEMLESLKQVQKKREEKKRDSNKQQQEQQSDEGDQPLVDSISELKLIKTLQLRVNRRTQTLAKQTNNQEDIVGQIVDPNLRGELEDLADRQQKIHEVAREILLKAAKD